MKQPHVSSPLRAAARVSLNRPRVVGLVLAVVVAETALRLALGVAEPLAVVLCPPVVPVPLLGAAAPAVRAAVRDPTTAPDWHLTARLRAVGPRLFTATLGHIAAVALGAVLFILIDTPVRFAIYAFGGSVPGGVVVFSPLVGVALGTLLAWGALAPGLARVAAGDCLRDAVRTPVETAFSNPRRTGTLVGVVLAGEAIVTVAGVVSLVYIIGTPLVVFLSVVVGLFLLASVLVAPCCYVAVVAVVDDATTGVRETDGGRSSSPRIPVRRAVAACLIILGLVTGASAMRVTETRPMSNATTPLPSDPTAAYATAVSNTVASNNRIEYQAVNRNHEQNVTRTLDVTRVLDRTDRSLRISYRSGKENTTAYYDAGVKYGGEGTRFIALSTRRIDRYGEAWAYPGYWFFSKNYNPTGSFGIPTPNTGTWKVVSRGSGTETLEIDGPEAFRAARVGSPENATYHSAWIRMRIDTDRGVLLGGRARLNATSPNLDFHPDVSARYDVKTGPDVTAHRPAKLGPRTPGEWLWKLFAY